MTERTHSIVRASLTEAVSAAKDWIDSSLMGQWHEITTHRMRDGKYRVTIKVRDDRG